MADNCLIRDVNGGKLVPRRRDLAGPHKEYGPMFGCVELLDSLPMSTDGAGAMRQQLPSCDDLRRIMQSHPRVVAGYEVLLMHYRSLLLSARAVLTVHSDGDMPDVVRGDL